MTDLAVLISIYNDEEALFVALDSIDEPDYSFTVVIVDGGSDRAPLIDPNRYPFRITMIREENNDGLAAGLNVGIDYIQKQGFQFLARFDAGDKARKNRLSIQYQRFQEKKDLVLLGSNVVFVNENTGEDLFTTDLPTTWEEIRKWSVCRTCFIHPSVMLRLAPLDSTYRYDVAYPHIEDYVLFSRIAEKFPSEVIKEPLVDCLVREKGISRSKDRQQLLSGVRHHLAHPRLQNPLWYAFILKRLVYLGVPYSLRNWMKGFLRLVDTQSNEKPGTKVGV